jgi:hypothetical protein
MEKSVDKKLFPLIEKKEWERVLFVMVKNGRMNGYVDYDSNGKMEFYDSCPFIGGVHAMPVDIKSIQEIINSY